MLNRPTSLSPKKLVERIRQNFVVKPMDETCEEVAEWFETPIGEYQLDAENRLISEQLSNLFGYHFMQLSICDNVNFAKSSRINHCFSLSPCSCRIENSPYNVQAISQFDALPFEDEQIDVTVLHHVLEFSENPHQVLKEAARVTLPRGYILIVGFNPLSLDGVLHRFGRLFSGRPIWKRHSLNIRRMKDWLEFLDFSCVDVRYASYNLSINNSSYLAKSGFIDRLLGGKKMPFGSSYCMLARKDKVGLTPIKPIWDHTPLIHAFPLPKRAMKMPAEKSGLVLPFRTKVKKGL